jgi:hypothetical protein
MTVPAARSMRAPGGRRMTARVDPPTEVQGVLAMQVPAVRDTRAQAGRNILGPAVRRMAAPVVRPTMGQVALRTRDQVDLATRVQVGRVTRDPAVRANVAHRCASSPKYRALIERISGYPMSEAARARILAEVEAAYRREGAAREAALRGGSTAPAGQGGT